MDVNLVKSLDKRLDKLDKFHVLTNAIDPANVRSKRSKPSFVLLDLSFELVLR